MEDLKIHPVQIVATEFLSHALDRPRTAVSSIWEKAENYLLNAYQYSSILTTSLSVVALVEGILIRDPKWITAGMVSMFLFGGGFILAQKYKKLKKLNEVTNELETEVGTLSKEVGTMSSQNKKFKTQIEDFEKENKDYKINIDLLQKTNSAAKKEIENFKSENGKLHGEVEKLKNIQVQFSTNLGALENDTEALKLLKDQYDTLKERMIKSQIENEERLKKEQELNRREEISVNKIEQLQKRIESFSQDKEILEKIKKNHPKIYQNALVD